MTGYEPEITENEDGTWTVTYQNLPGLKDKSYSVSENSITGYISETSSVSDGGRLTNKLETITVAGEKTWEDNNNENNKRPDSITVNLLADGKLIKSAEVKAAADGTWTYSFENLPKYEAGRKIVYTVSEEKVADYSTAVNGYDITNSYTPGKTSVTITKIWNDSNNQDGLRPNAESFASMVHLYNGDTEVTGVTPAVTDNGDDTYTVTYSNLPKYSNGTEIVYTVREDAVNGYTSSTSERVATGSTITNYHTPETVSVSGTKTWDDGNNQDGKRPDSITVNLLADGKLIKSAEVKAAADGTWTYSFENLPKYEAGRKIVYTVSEEKVADYSTAVNGYDITNSYTPGKTSVTITKIWNDSSNQDGLRPNAESFASMVHLYNGDAEVTGVTPVVKDNGNNTYTVTFSDLPAYADGKPISYTVREDSISGYTADHESVSNGEALTNTHTVPEKPTPSPAPSAPSTPSATSTPSDPGRAESHTPSTSAGSVAAARPYTLNTSDTTGLPLYAGMFAVSSAVILMMLTKWRKELFRR